MLDYRTLPAWLPQELVRPVEAGWAVGRL